MDWIKDTTEFNGFNRQIINNIKKRVDQKLIGGKTTLLRTVNKRERKYDLK